MSTPIAEGIQQKVIVAGFVERKGVQGDSAYVVAVTEGFEGTEAEWLVSLQGADGSDGANGTDGADGAPGSPGTNGSDGATGLTGDAGPKGDTGNAGAPGADGVDGAPGADGIGVPDPAGATDGQTIAKLGTVWTIVDPAAGGSSATLSSRYKGRWSSATTYASGDLVLKAGAIWEAVADSTGHDPVAPPEYVYIGGSNNAAITPMGNQVVQEIIDPAVGTYPYIRITSRGPTRVGFSRSFPADAASVDWLGYVDLTEDVIQTVFTLSTPVTVGTGETLFMVAVGNQAISRGSTEPTASPTLGSVWLTSADGGAFTREFTGRSLSLQAFGLLAGPVWGKALDADLRGTAAPTTGTWAVGDTVGNSAPTAGGVVGWVCTVAGTPGTWVPFGNTPTAAEVTADPTGMTVLSGTDVQAVLDSADVAIAGKQDIAADVTANRPASPTAGQSFFDTTIGKPIWWNGTAWKDATGITV